MSALISLIISVAVGAVVWLVLPTFLGGFVKKKSTRKSVGLLCKIIGIVIIILAVLDFFSNIFSGLL